MKLFTPAVLSAAVLGAALAPLATASAHARGMAAGHGLAARNVQPMALLNKRGAFHAALTKRQVDSDEALAQCTDQCSTYISTASSCSSEETTQEAALACACSDSFFAAIIQCGNCAPDAFTDSAGMTLSEAVQAAATQCSAAGHPVNIDAFSISTGTASPSSTSSSAGDTSSGSTSTAVSSASSAASSASATASSAAASATKAVSSATASESTSSAAATTGSEGIGAAGRTLTAGSGTIAAVLVLALASIA